MKSNSTIRTPKPLSFTVFAALLATALFFVVSCSKDTNSSGAMPAYIMAANTAQGSAAQDFYVDNNKLNASALAYTQSTSYFNLTPGDTHQGQFKTSSNSTVDASFSLQLAPGGYYSAYFGDNNTANVYPNDRTQPQGSDARVRFINLSSAMTSNVDFAGTVNGKTMTLVSGLASKASSSYNEVSTLSNTFTLSAAGSSSVLLSIPVVLQAGKIYSVVVSGSSTATLTYSLVVEN